MNNLPSKVDIPPGETETVRPKADKAAPAEEGPVQLPIGMTLGAKWKIVKKLGEGGCGAVYLVTSTESGVKAALKAESLAAEGGSVLKIEVDVLSKLRGKRYVCEYLGAGRLAKFQYIVMSLLGESLEGMLKLCGNVVSCSTQLRVGIQVLHGLKQIHDAGFVHRDIKPANLALGRADGGTDPNFIYILDFGLSRSFIKDDAKGRKELRKPRRSALFRGTARYCSADANLKHDQSRIDDIWSMVYLLVEMRGKLPWENLNEHKELAEAKLTAPDKELFCECPSQMRDLSRYLKSLNYFSKPDYPKMYGMFMEAMKDGGYSFTDPLDWQLVEKVKGGRKGGGGSGGKPGAPSKVSSKPAAPRKTSVVATKKGGNVRTAKSIAETKAAAAATATAAPAAARAAPPTENWGDIVLPTKDPFTMDDFTADPLGI
ncbi:hypothetical protein PRIPAC_93373 [Pristionchus pacificus]|uniref:Protein kinase domain-containing protein n=1 Tax=Pristionchus pacificus TaxID=54126 RepID=A0A2A6CI06_PRIPA|nr:hypothetical protein PRIPAC_93373 [Pristionchus pacificus]|eukprot:PDM77864.1 protein kinase [Pristionchus pacificus]